MNIPPPIHPPQIKQTFDVRYGVYYCLICNLALDYCRGHADADPPAKDGDSTQLAQHIAEVVARRGSSR